MAAVAGLLVVVLTATASARSTAASSGRFERLAGAFNYSGFKPGISRGNGDITAIVELDGDPVAKVEAKRGKKLSSSEKASIRNDLEVKQQGVKSRAQAAGGQVLYDYQDAYNGVAVRVPVSALASLASTPGVVAVHPSRNIPLENVAGVQYIRGNEAWAVTGFTGRGQRIAVIDTGVDYTHANFGGPGTPAAYTANNGTVIEPGSFPTAKVVGGTDFVGDDYDADSSVAANTIPKPDPDPLDCEGHGSHTTGSAAGEGVLANGTTFTGPYDATTYTHTFNVGPGVAPEASILAYRVFGCGATATSADDVVVAAINQAVADGATVISMSLGAPFGRTDAPDSVAADNASLDGVVVVAAAGNSSPSAYIHDSPGASDRTIAAAAIDASGPTTPAATISGLANGQSIVAQNSNGATLPSGSMQVAVLRTSYPNGPVSLGCNPNEYGSYPGGVAGKLVVTLRGTCARVARAIFGQKAGAAAVAMINTDAGFPPFEGLITSNPDTGEKFTVTIPFLGVKGTLASATSDGSKLAASDGASVTLAATTVPNPGYQSLASFSSGGPRNVDSAVKPDVIAPGVSVLSTAVGTGNQGTRMSGTSMATPMTSGAAALVRQANPTWTPEQVKAALMDTANNTSAKILGYNIRTGGSGVVDARRAVDTVGLITTQAGRGNLSYGAEALSSAYSETLPFTIQNTSGSPVTYDLTSAFQSTLGATLTLSSSSVTVPAHGSQTVNATLALSAAAVAALPGAETSNFGALVTIRGTVTATPQSSGTGIYPLHIPFLVAPRGLSNVTAGAKTDFKPQPGGPLFSSQMTVSNSGIHGGSAEVYAWGIHDANDVAHPEDSMDVRDVGVETLPGAALGSTEDDRALIFAVDTYGRWSNPSVSEIDVAVDVNGDNNADFLVVGVDFGALTTGTFDGRFTSFTLDADGNLIDAWVADAPMNGGVALLPVLASEIGLTSAHSAFRYSVAAFSIVPGGLVDTTSTAEFDAFAPPVSTGDFADLAPGSNTQFTLSYDQSKVAKSKSLGWLVVTPDDAAGSAQAEEVDFKPKKG